MKIEEYKKKVGIAKRNKKIREQEAKKKIDQQKITEYSSKPKENQIIPILQMTTKESLLHLLINQIKDKKLKRI